MRNYNIGEFDENIAIANEVFIVDEMFMLLKQLIAKTISDTLSWKKITGDDNFIYACSDKDTYECEVSGKRITFSLKKIHDMIYYLRIRADDISSELIHFDFSCKCMNSHNKKVKDLAFVLLNIVRGTDANQDFIRGLQSMYEFRSALEREGAANGEQ